MAKRAVPGRVKTRLIGPLSADQAAAVHAAMLECVLRRVRAHVPGTPVLALDAWPADADAGAPVEPAGDAVVAALAGDSDWRVLDQGSGALGDRLNHVWSKLGGGPVVFFGVDVPDVPSAALQGIVPALASHDAAIGPAADGGYWTLAAAQSQPALLEGIDWGTARVYHQTCDAAKRAGLRWCALTRWRDVDDSAGLTALQRRLRRATEPALVTLHHRLQRIVES